MTTLLDLIDRAPLAFLLAVLLLLAFAAFILLSDRIRLTLAAILTILPLAPILIIRCAAAAIVNRCDRFLHTSKVCAPARRRARWLDHEFNPPDSQMAKTGELQNADCKGNHYLRRAHVALARDRAGVARRMFQRDRL